MTAARGILGLIGRQRSARDGVAVMGEHLLNVQRGQAEALREGGRALARAATVLTQATSALPAASDDRAGAPENGARAAPPIDGEQLAARAAALLPQLDALDPRAIQSFDPGRIPEFSALAGDSGLAPVASGVAAVASRLMDLEQHDPAAFGRLASTNPALKPFLANASLGDLALTSYDDEARGMKGLLPNLSTGMQTEAALTSDLNARLAQIESGRRELDGLRR
jgi:hypothetical protein